MAKKLDKTSEATTGTKSTASSSTSTYRGLEHRGTRPAPGTRSVTRKQWKEQRQVERLQNMPVVAKDAFALKAYCLRKGYALRPLPRRSARDVLVAYDVFGKPHSVWVRPGSRTSPDIQRLYDGYRSAFKKVFRKDLPDEYVIDHLQSSARGGQQGYDYVRLVLVRKDINEAWGGYSELRLPQGGRGTGMSAKLILKHLIKKLCNEFILSANVILLRS